MTAGRSPKVDEFIARLAHGRKGEIEHLRSAILGSSADMTERIKWNAPSFCCDGDDRVTFRLQPGDGPSEHGGASEPAHVALRLADLTLEVLALVAVGRLIESSMQRRQVALELYLHPGTGVDDHVVMVGIRAVMPLRRAILGYVEEHASESTEPVLH